MIAVWCIIHRTKWIIICLALYLSFSASVVSVAWFYIVLHILYIEYAFFARRLHALINLSSMSTKSVGSFGLVRRRKMHLMSINERNQLIDSMRVNAAVFLVYMWSQSLCL